MKTIASDIFCSITNLVARTNFKKISFFTSNEIYFRPIIVLLLAGLAFYPVISFSSVIFSDRKLPIAIYLFNTFTLSTEFIFGEEHCPLSNDINPLQKFLSRWKVFARDVWKKDYCVILEPGHYVFVLQNNIYWTVPSLHGFQKNSLENFFSWFYIEILWNKRLIWLNKNILSMSWINIVKNMCYANMSHIHLE